LKTLTTVLVFLLALTFEFSMIQTVEAQTAPQNGDCSDRGGYAGRGRGGYDGRSGGGYGGGGYGNSRSVNTPCPETSTSNAPMRIFVANLNLAVMDDDLYQMFSEYGEVQSAQIIMDQNTGRSRGFGYVVMPGQAAREAIRDLDGSECYARSIVVRPAE
jgi:hypothetical protein